MTLHTRGLALVLVLVAGCGGGETAASVRDDTRASFAELTTILESVVDEESARAAKSKLEAFRGRLRQIESHEVALSESERTKLSAMRVDLQREAYAAMQAEFQRIMSDPKLSAQLTSVLMEIADETR